MRIEILKGKQIIDSGLAEQVIEFDKHNMQSILETAGIAFPEEKRRRDLQSNPTFIIAFENGAMAGYIEYLRSWRDPKFIYVGSLQIAEKHRHTRLILKLLDEFKSAVSDEDFVGFETNVQKTNLPAIKIYQKLGFKLQENPNNQASWLATAEKDLLETSPIVSLVERWREKSRVA